MTRRRNLSSRFGEKKVTKSRKKSNQVEGKSNQVGNQVEQKSNEVEEKSNQVQDSDTRLRHSDTKKVSLSNKQRDIVNFCSVPRTTAEIMERLGLSNNDATVYNSKAKFTVKEL